MFDFELTKETQRAVARIQRKLERKNAKFREMTKPQQRVAIARDVLEQLGHGVMEPASTYLTSKELDVRDNDNSESVGVTHLKALQNIELGVALTVAGCEVCGIGSVFVSACRLADRMSVRRYRNILENRDTRLSMVRYLRPWFSGEQLNLIEGVFEDSHFASWVIRHGLGVGGMSAESRLEMIMENIISNKGVFDPYYGRHAISDHRLEGMDRPQRKKSRD